MIESDSDFDSDIQNQEKPGKMSAWSKVNSDSKWSYSNRNSDSDSDSASDSLPFITSTQLKIFIMKFFANLKLFWTIF